MDGTSTSEVNPVSTDSESKLVGRRRRALVMAGVGASSAAVLVLEIALTRVFAVTQFYHFAFLTVSMALLGYGASGAALTLFPGLGRGARRWWLLGFLQSLAIVGGYLATNALPFDSFAIAWDRYQLLYLVLYYLALAVPFFFGGAVVGAVLASAGDPGAVASHRVYASSLVGSGVGCVIVIGVLDRTGAEGAVALAALLAMLGTVAFGAIEMEPARLVISIGVAVVLVVMTLATPAMLDMKLSPYKDLAAALRYPGAEVVATTWEQGTRIDEIHSDGIRSLPGLSFAYPGAPPPQAGLTFDADDLSPVPLVTASEAEFVPHLMSSLPFQLRPSAQVLVVEPRGGLDVLVADASGARSIDVVEPHAAATVGAIYDEPHVEVVADSARAYVAGSDELYDVVDLALTAPYRPVASGAYSLGEDYRLTVEAFDSYLERLDHGGILAAMRWIQDPPSEETRLIALAAESVRDHGGDPERSIVALRGYATALVMVQPDGFTVAEIEAIVDFAEQRRFDLIAAPGLDPETTNRYNVVPDDEYSPLAAALLISTTPDDVYRDYRFEIAPPRDDHPFFAHFFKWSQTSDVLDSLGRTWQPFGGAGFFVLIALLALSTVAAIVLISGPLLMSRDLRSAGGAPARLRWWTFGYFALLGMGFLLVEIPLIQQYILLIGSPATALAVVLFAVLIASGLGSLFSRRIPWRGGAAVLAAILLIYPWLIRSAVQALLAAPFVVRVTAGALAILPVAFLMGIMFPSGLRHLEGRGRRLIPWAWGINGTVSVIAAAAAAVLTLTFGFSFVIWTGALAYVAAMLMVPRRDFGAGSAV